jgi:polyphenol oxidase
MWLGAPNLSVRHGFSTRHGGISPAPYTSLNLGGQEDDPSNIQHNRSKALQELEISPDRIANLRQVHGSEVVIVSKSGTYTGDALATREKGVALAISIADCYPLLFHDPDREVIGAAHAGWRGTVAHIAARTVEAMQELGADPSRIRVAIGQGICRDNFEVGEEVLQQFRENGFPESCIAGRHIDLLKANRHVLLSKGVAPEHIWAMNRCTYEQDFFSYRRDKGRTGRMWAVIML